MDEVDPIHLYVIECQCSRTDSVGVNEQQEEEEVGMQCSLFVFIEKIDFSYSIDTTLVFVGPPWNARNTLVSKNVGLS